MKRHRLVEDINRHKEVHREEKGDEGTDYIKKIFKKTLHNIKQQTDAVCS